MKGVDESALQGPFASLAALETEGVLQVLMATDTPFLEALSLLESAGMTTPLDERTKRLMIDFGGRWANRICDEYPDDALRGFLNAIRGSPLLGFRDCFEIACMVKDRHPYYAVIGLVDLILSVSTALDVVRKQKAEPGLRDPLGVFDLLKKYRIHPISVACGWSINDLGASVYNANHGRMIADLLLIEPDLTRWCERGNGFNVYQDEEDFEDYPEDEPLPMIEIQSLPEGLILSALRLHGVEGLKRLPDDLKTRELVLSNCPDLEQLPEGLELKRELVIANCPSLASLPSRLTIAQPSLREKPQLGNLRITNCSNWDGVLGEGVEVNEIASSLLPAERVLAHDGFKKGAWNLWNETRKGPKLQDDLHGWMQRFMVFYPEPQWGFLRAFFLCKNLWEPSRWTDSLESILPLFEAECRNLGQQSEPVERYSKWCREHGITEAMPTEFLVDLVHMDADAARWLFQNMEPFDVKSSVLLHHWSLDVIPPMNAVGPIFK